MFDSSATLDSRQLSILLQIQDHEAAIRDLKSRFNSFSSTARFPPEILTLVFDALADFSSCVGSTHICHIVQVSHVCRAWRQICLHHSPLWRNVCLNRSLRWISGHLSRAKLHPVVVRHVCDSEPKLLGCQKKLEYALAHAGRVGSLILRAPGRQETETFMKTLMRPFPSLRVFSIGHSRQSSQSRSYTLPETLFQSAPSLRSFEAKGCSLRSWGALELPQLTSLKLSFTSYAATFSIPALLQALRRMPRLRGLTLSFADTIEPWVTDALAHHDAVVLHHLQDLHIHSWCLGSQNLLRYVTVPSLMTASLDFEINRHEICEVSDIAHFLSTLEYGPQRLHTLRMQQLYKRGQQKFIIEGPSSQNRIMINFRHSSESFRASMMKDIDIMLKLCEAPLLHNIVVLDTWGDFLTANDYHRLFGGLPNLADIRITCFPEAILEVLGSQPARPSFAVPFPALRHLTLQRCHLNQVHDFTLLKNVVRFRTSCLCQTSMDTLTINECVTNRRQIDDLRTFVDVRWDEEKVNRPALDDCILPDKGSRLVEEVTDNESDDEIALGP